jgi:hypothetical protein
MGESRIRKVPMRKIRGQDAVGFVFPAGVVGALLCEWPPMNDEMMAVVARAGKWPVRATLGVAYLNDKGDTAGDYPAVSA